MKSKCLVTAEGSDIISTLPHIILETILCILPTEEAARTSILSREWRYKWTKLPKLKFNLFDVSKRINEEKQVEGKRMNTCELFSALHQILLSHQGPIHEFTLYIDSWDFDHDDIGLDQIILYLSKNHILKKFKFCGFDFEFCYNLPNSVFSLHHLTDLDLSFVDVERQPIFNEFSGLRSLVLVHVWISTKNLLHLLSKCPSLKSLTHLTYEVDRDDRHCPVIELFKCLPMIENLIIYMDVLKWLVMDSVPKGLPTPLLHLKYFCFKDMCFDEGYGLSFLLVLIKCSSNLEKMKLETDWGNQYIQSYSFVWEEYSDVWLEHLNELEIARFGNTMLEMEFIKFILARSPKLKKVRIQSVVYGDEKLKMVEVLLRAPRASPVIIYV